jgi:hypothetical protein
MVRVYDDLVYSQTKSGMLIGVGKWIGVMIIGQITFYGDLTEYQVKILKEFKNVNVFADFYQIDDYTECSLGIGYEFFYRIRKRR